jgi:hypothetical protein
MSFCGSTRAQELPHARLLFADSAVVAAFPHQAQVDSVAAVHQRSKYLPQPDIRFRLLHTDGSAENFPSRNERSQDEAEAGPVCFIGLTVEWTGAISAARVLTCQRGNIATEKLLRLVRQLRADVVSYGVGGFPVEWSIPVRPSDVR